MVSNGTIGAVRWDIVRDGRTVTFQYLRCGGIKFDTEQCDTVR